MEKTDIRASETAIQTRIQDAMGMMSSNTLCSKQIITKNGKHVLIMKASVNWVEGTLSAELVHRP